MSTNTLSLGRSACGAALLAAAVLVPVLLLGSEERASARRSDLGGPALPIGPRAAPHAQRPAAKGGAPPSPTAGAPPTRPGEGASAEAPESAGVVPDAALPSGLVPPSPGSEKGAYVFYLYGSRRAGLWTCCTDLLTAVFTLRRTEAREHGGAVRRRVLLLLASEQPLDRNESTTLWVLGVEVRRVPLLQPDKKTYCYKTACGSPSSPNVRLCGSFTQFHVWNQTDLDMAVFMDGDTLVRRSLDFMLPSAAAPPAKDLRATLSGCRSCDDKKGFFRGGHSLRINTGVMAIRPSREVFAEFMKILGGSFEVMCFEGNQNVIAETFALTMRKLSVTFGCFEQDWNCRMNSGGTLCACASGNQTLPVTTGLLHFSGRRKPWHIKDARQRESLTGMERHTVHMWWRCYTSMQRAVAVAAASARQVTVADLTAGYC